MLLVKISWPCIVAAIAVAPATALAQTAPPPSAAETQGDAVLGEIIVTAQKRAENLQDVPIAVTAFTGDVLAERGVTDAQSLARLVPNVTFSDKNGEARISLRGLGFDNLWGTSAEPRVAYHVDGYYLSQSADIGGTFFDIERIEVNRGPQGTLFGRNAVGGTVNLITRDPTDQLSGYLNAEVGNYQTANTDGAISGPLGHGVSARIAFQTRNHSGYDYNVTNQVDVNNLSTQAFRGKLKFDKSSSFTIVLSTDYFRERDRIGGILIGLNNPQTTQTLPSENLGGIARDGDPRHDYSDTLPSTKRTSYGFGLDAKLDIGNGFSLTSLTSYRQSKYYYAVDIDLSSIPLIFAENWIESKQFSEELRLSKDFERGNLVVGAYFFGENYFAKAQVPLDIVLFGGPYGGGLLTGIDFGGHTRTRAVAGFGQFTYQLSDSTKLIAGARYSLERKRKRGEYFAIDLATSFDPGREFMSPTGTTSDSVTYHNFSPRVTLEQKIGPNQLLYATYAKGFKTGGYNLGQVQAGYKPESLTDYEVGFKLGFLDRKVRLNGAAFYYSYKNIQVPKTEFSTSFIVNAASAKIYGAELELTAVPTRGLELDASAAVLKTKFTSFESEDPSRPALGVIDLVGNRLPNAPKYTLSYGAQYTFDTSIGAIIVRGDGQTISQVYFDQFNVAPNSEKSYTVLNASIAWKDIHERFSVTAFVRNLTDGLNKNGAFVYGGFVGYPLTGNYNPPRTFGVRFGVNF